MIQAFPGTRVFCRATNGTGARILLSAAQALRATSQVCYGCPANAQCCSLAEELQPEFDPELTQLALPF